MPLRLVTASAIKSLALCFGGSVAVERVDEEVGIQEEPIFHSFARAKNGGRVARGPVVA